jgi:hypothetical protein
MVEGGEELLLEFESFDAKPINLTYSLSSSMTLQQGTSYYFEYFSNKNRAPLHILVPKNSYSFFYSCNNFHQYESSEEAQIIGNIELGFGKKFLISVDNIKGS